MSSSITRQGWGGSPEFPPYPQIENKPTPTPKPPARIPSRTSADTLNKSASPADERQYTSAAEGTTVRVVYGKDQVGPYLGPVVTSGSNLIVCWIWCVGPIEAIDAVEVNGEPLPANVTLTHYLGTTSQGVDPTLAGIVGFNDDFVIRENGVPVGGLAYTVAVIPNQSAADVRATATIRGRNDIFSPDPYVEEAYLFDTDDYVLEGTTGYTDNPALCHAHFITDTVNGQGEEIIWGTVYDAAAANDETVGTGGSAQARRKIGLSLERKQTSGQWSETLRAYSACFLTRHNGKLAMIPENANKTTSISLTASDILAGSLKLSQRQLDDTPTVVIVEYTDTTTKPWRDRRAVAKLAGVDDGTVPRRESKVSLPGIHRYSQAMREATERLNIANFADLFCSMVVFDKGIQIMPGDVVEVTHPIGLTAKKMWCIKNEMVGIGRWGLELLEFDPANYNDEVQTAPSYPDTDLPSPLDPPAPTNMVLAEEVYAQETGIYASRIRTTWDDPGYAFVDHWELQVETGGDLVYQATSPKDTRDIVSPAIQEGKTYTVRTRVVTTAGAPSDWTEDTILAEGKGLIPGDVPWCSAFEVGGETRISWGEAVDIDIWRYEVRYGAAAVTWDNATTLDIVDALTLNTKNVPPGTWDILVKAVDSIKQRSANAARASGVVVDLDDKAYFVGENEFTSPTLTNARKLWSRDPNNSTYVTDMQDGWGSLFPLTMDNYANVMATYHASGTSEWLSETWDLGALYSGVWRMEHTAEALSGTITVEMELSENGTAWTAYTAASVRDYARYARIRVKALTTSTFKLTTPGMTIRLDVDAKEESGDGTSSASAATTITLDRDYDFVKAISITPIGNTAMTWTVDNLTTGDPSSFDVYIFNSSGTQIANAFKWRFLGV